MPKKIEGWKCGMCGDLYSEEANAEQCEARHTEKKPFIQSYSGYVSVNQSERHTWSNPLYVPNRVVLGFSEIWGDFASYTLKQFGPTGL